MDKTDSDKRNLDKTNSDSTRTVRAVIPDFSLQQIGESGQCFRLNRIAQNRYALVAFGKYLEVEQAGDELLFACTREEYDGIWREYFDLDNDYARYRAAVPAQDRYLSEAAAFGSGIRILRQDVWEMLISFIISQQNNIKRIRKCIETLCVRYGERQDIIHGVNAGENENTDTKDNTKADAKGIAAHAYYTFPTVEALAGVPEEELRACNLGYRSKYIVNTANRILHGDVALDALKKMDYKQAKEELLKLCGVGEKVADCICLFGLHHMDAFPVDTHIRKALDGHYPTGFPVEKYAGYAGVMQQYIFYYDLKRK
ncbi:MAG: 8-oxoguanine DNA glycosylase [Eubacterium sp.]|nr:8-oxoguanine DNA glycosylase [Eubacterium sp.]